jgi:hypothetical protein
MGGSPWLRGSSTAGLVLFFTSATAAAAPSEGEGSTPAPVQRPAALKDAPADPPPDAKAPDTAATPTEAAPEGDTAADPDATIPDPDAIAAPEGSEDPDQGSSPTVDPNLLEGKEEATRPPARDVEPTVEDEDARDAALASEYKQRYRPEENPGRFNLGVRALFANAGGGERIGGRMGGVQVDAGMAWNYIGVALTGSLFGGRVFLPDRVAEMNVLVGGGPTLNLGRMALLGRGYLDLRVGYDFFYGAVNQRRDDPTVVAPQGDPDLRLEQAENLAPHGPRVQLNMGLLSHANHRRFIHGFGFSMGYQALVGSFRGDLPFTNMLTLGLSYWMG